MSGFLRWSVLGGLVLAGLLVLVVEALCWGNGELRGPLYWGGGAGFGINLLGYPFIVKLAALTPEEVRSGVQWNWFLYSVLARLAGLGGLMYALPGRFPGHERAVTLMAILVYLVGLFAELAWIARRFNAMDTK